MKLNIDSLVNKKKEYIQFELIENLNSLELSGEVKQIKGPVKISGKVSRVGKDFLMDAVVELTIIDECSRCLKELEDCVKIKIDTYLVKGSYDEDSFENYDVYKFEESDINLVELIELTSTFGIDKKLLCSEDCRGLCPGCGVDLNIHECECNLDETRDIDPRLEKLKELL